MEPVHQVHPSNDQKPELPEFVSAVTDKRGEEKLKYYELDLYYSRGNGGNSLPG